MASGLATALLAWLAGSCEAAPTGREDVAAEAGAEVLLPERLATWLARVPSGQPTARDAETVALVWTDYSLLQQALAAGRSLTDSAALETVLEPDRLLLTIRIWHDTLASRRPPLAPDRADSLYAGSHRLFQHILIRFNPDDARSVADARRRADSALAAARGGEDFAAVARRYSEDPTAVGGGYLPVRNRGEMSPEFARSAWPLAPGQVEAFTSRLGVHLVRRPPLAEVRDRFLAYADTVATRLADADHAEALRGETGYTFAPGALGALREFFEDPTARRNEATLATWKGGALSLEQAATWIELLPAASYVELRGASDNTLEDFVRDVALQYMLRQQADSAGVVPTAAESAQLVQAYRRALRESLALLGVNDSLPSLSPGQGAGRVAALVEGLTADRVRWRPLPSALGAWLRRELGYRLYRAGLERAAELARDQATRPGG